MNKISLTCSGSLNTNCQSCDSNNYRHLDNNECICDDGFYENSAPLCGTCNSYWQNYIFY